MSTQSPRRGVAPRRQFGRPVAYLAALLVCVAFPPMLIVVIPTIVMSAYRQQVRARQHAQAYQKAGDRAERERLRALRSLP